MGATIPNVQIDGAAVDVLNGTHLTGALVSVALCGYGAQTPRVINDFVYNNLTSLDVIADSNGQYHFTLVSNDLIVPGGTYYTFTYKNQNGDIQQVMAYRFIGPGQWDTSVLQPYDPNQPPPPLPPLITNQLLVVPWSATPEFPGDVYTTFRITLTGDVTSSTAPDTVQGNLYTFIIFQDATGGHLFTWPANTGNATPINPNPNALTVQTFVMGLADLVPIGAGTWAG